METKQRRQKASPGLIGSLSCFFWEPATFCCKAQFAEPGYVQQHTPPRSQLSGYCVGHWLPTLCQSKAKAVPNTKQIWNLAKEANSHYTYCYNMALWGEKFWGGTSRCLQLQLVRPALTPRPCGDPDMVTAPRLSPGSSHAAGCFLCHTAHCCFSNLLTEDGGNTGVKIMHLNHIFSDKSQFWGGLEISPMPLASR